MPGALSKPRSSYHRYSRRSLCLLWQERGLTKRDPSKSSCDYRVAQVIFKKVVLYSTHLHDRSRHLGNGSTPSCGEIMRMHRGAHVQCARQFAHCLGKLSIPLIVSGDLSLLCCTGLCLRMFPYGQTRRAILLNSPKVNNLQAALSEGQPRSGHAPPRRRPVC